MTNLKVPSSVTRSSFLLLTAGVLSGCEATPTDVPAAAAASVVAAGSRQEVDPATLIPPLDPEIFVCFTQGPGIVCDGVQPNAYTEWSPGPDLACGDRLILLTGFQLETARSWNDAAGRRLRSKVYGRFDERWRLEGSDGPGLEVHGRWNEDRLWGTPGDVSTRTITVTGNEVWATAPGRGVVFQNAGITRLDPNFDVVGQAGPHDFYTDFEGALAAACEVLEAQ